MTDPAITEEIIGMLVISAASMGLLGWYSIRSFRRVPAALPYSLLMFASAGWAILYASDLSTGSLPLRILFHDLRFLFLPFMPLLELWLVIAYVQQPGWLRRDRMILLLVIPVISLVLALTSGYHTLFRYGFFIDTSGPVPVLNYLEGPGILLLDLYSLALLLLTLAILARESSRTGTLREIQTLLLFVALAFPTTVNYLFLAGVTPVHQVNFTAPLLWIPAILYTVAIFRYRFLDILPVARSRLIEIMTTPVLVLDREGRIIDLNHAAASLFSVDPPSAMGRRVTELAPDWPEFIHLCGEQGTCRYNLTRGRGIGTRFFLGSAEPLAVPSGGIEGRIILLQDITDLKTTERELKESERKFALAFRSSPYAITITRLADGTILDANDGFERMSGYPLTEVIGKTVQALNLWADPKDRDAMVRDLEAGVRIAGREYGFRTRSGRVLTCLFSAEVITIRNAAHILSSINDISDRKKAEEEREKMIRELQRKNAELDRFAYTVSHDLRSPLVSIQGFSELAESDLAQGDVPTTKNDIRKIRDASSRMETLITTLLALSRSGKAVDNPVPVDLGDVAREAAGMLDSAIRERSVRVGIQENLPAVAGDRQRLLQVILNLMDNAIKFMGDQKDPAIGIGADISQAGPVFFVQDNGKGIPADAIDRIFELFTRFDTSVPGAGIGLATVRRIIEAHGGKIWAESEGVGKGTTFRFTLPGTGDPEQPGG